jgi:SPX domain protein involved in polyphosphate accumulation
MSNLSHSIRSFNRFELKYLLTLREAENFKKALGAYLIPDSHGDSRGAYNLASLYYDSPDYRFYWEKVDGIRFRRKLRIRWYDTGLPLEPNTPVFVEIKQRLNRVTQKRRVLVSYQDAVDLCTRRKTPDFQPQDGPLMEEILSLCWQYDLRPASVVTYSRQALVGSDYDTGLRVTFDKDLRYSTHHLDLSETGSDLFLFPPEYVVMEIKVNERIPYWLTELVAQHNLNLVRVSKYCTSIELAQKVAAPTWRFIPA